MGHTTYVHQSDQIAIEPAIGWVDLAPRLSEATPSPYRYSDDPIAYTFDGSGHVTVGDIRLRLETERALDADGTERIRRRAVAIVAGSEERYKAYRLDESIARVITDFATAPDGTPRAFPGHLTCDGDEHYQWRLYVRDGRVVEAEPETTYTAPPGNPVGPQPLT